MYSFQFDTDGNLRVTSSGGGGGDVTIVGQTVTVMTEDAADGIIGSPVGTDAIQIGYKDGSGNLQIPSAANPLPVTIGGGANVPTNIAQYGGVSTSLGSKVSASSIPVVIASDQGAVAISGSISITGNPADNIAQWGGTAVTAPPATGVPAVGTEVAPVVKPIARKSTVTLTTTPLAANGVFTSSSGTGPNGWFDTNATGDIWAELSSYADQAGASNGFIVQGSDDPTNANLTRTLFSTASESANVLVTLQGPIPTRYWRVVYTNGVTLQTVFELNATSMNLVPGQYIAQASGSFNQLWEPVVVGSPSIQDGQAAVGIYDVSLVARVLATMGGFTTSAAQGGAYVMARTPNIMRGGIAQAGTTLIWGPAGSKKPRLMKYKLEIGEDSSYASAATPVMLDWVMLPYGVNQPLGPNNPRLSHRVQIPTTALATNGVLWDSDWVDLGNGAITQFSNQAWQLAISIAQPASPTTPTWTITSNQWEAICFGFKSLGTLGGARLLSMVQATGVGSAVTVSSNFAKGSTLIAIVRTTNIAAGAPTITLTDSQGVATWTSGAIVTNASDGANGSSIQIFWITAPLANGFASNTVTATTSTHVATITHMMVLEVGGLIAAAGGATQTSGTGNSTAPAAGAYTPGEVGDYIVSFFGSAANITAPVMATATYQARGQIDVSAGTLAFADNIGNGTFAAGGVNVVAIGTEE